MNKIDKEQVKAELEKREWIHIKSHPYSRWMFMKNPAAEHSPYIELFNNLIDYGNPILLQDEGGEFWHSNKKEFSTLEDLLKELDK